MSIALQKVEAFRESVETLCEKLEFCVWRVVLSDAFDAKIRGQPGKKEAAGEDGATTEGGQARKRKGQSSLETSEDWIVNPGRIELLTDYVGWVPVPTVGPSEAIWHTAGQPIQFNLQITTLDVEISEATS